MSFNVLKIFNKRYIYLSTTSLIKTLSMSISVNGPRDIKQKTLGLIIIGDEVLKGQVEDVNSLRVTKSAAHLGLKLNKISIIPDDLEVIASEVKHFSNIFDHVITSGGIGPTHDDVTYEAVALAFNDQTVQHPEILTKLRQIIVGFHPSTLSLEVEPRLKLGQVPATSRLNYLTLNARQARYPVISVKNVFILPGVPSLFQRSFEMVAEKIRNPLVKYYTDTIYCSSHEATLTPILNKFVSQYKDSVTFGSYPELYNSYYKVRFTMETTDKLVLDEIGQKFRAAISEDHLVNYDQNPIDRADEKIIKLANGSSYLGKKVCTALRVIDQMLDKYKLDQSCISFNGGKDCTALLHLYYAAVMRHLKKTNSTVTSSEKNSSNLALTSIYIRSGQPFPEVEEFLLLSANVYNLKMLTYEGDMKSSLGRIKTDQPHLETILMGTRTTDPNSKHLEPFAKTDPSWPQFMRVSPLLDWNHRDIWLFLRHMCLPYCSLYDRGYTSLGNMDNTHPNPALSYMDDLGLVRYRPAYELEEDCHERMGRNKSSKPNL